MQAHLYFANSALRPFESIPITADGSAAGKVSIIAQLPRGIAYDDFAIDTKGNAWITSHPFALDEVTPGGK